MHLVTILTNTVFPLNYDRGRLETEIELIFLFAKPQYTINESKKEIEKGRVLSEVRFNTTPKGVTEIIEQLQIILTHADTVQKIEDAVNEMIEPSKSNP